MRVEAFTDGQASIMADEPSGFNIGDPVQLKGQSRGWTPVHYQLAGLATCTSITITVVARDQKFAYRGLRTNIRSLIDIRGFFFDLHLQPKFEQINFDLWVETEESDARIKALAEETDRRCPQLGIYRLAKVRREGERDENRNGQKGNGSDWKARGREAKRERKSPLSAPFCGPGERDIREMGRSERER
jgi:uncharacterized OsmC-like protein